MDRYLNSNAALSLWSIWPCSRSETITTAFVESTVNEVVAKRMVKKQQLQWSPKGAHALLQTRTATLNGELSQYFERWYPGFPVANDENHDLHEVKLAA